MENNKRRITLLIIVIVLLLIVIIGASYAAFTATLNGSRTSTVTTATVSVVYTETSSISITNATPTADSTGKTLSSYMGFSVGVTSNANPTIKYTVYLTPTTTTLAASNIKAYLTTVSGSTETAASGFSTPPLVSALTVCTAAKCGSGVTTGNYILYEGTATPSGTASTPATVTTNFRLRLWLVSTYAETVTTTTSTSGSYTKTTATSSGGEFSAKVNVYAYTS